MRLRALTVLLLVLSSSQGAFGIEVAERDYQTMSVLVTAKDVLLTDRGIFFRHQGQLYSCTTMHVTDEGIIASGAAVWYCANGHPNFP